MAEAAGHSISQGNFISDDPETLGFDLSSGAKWIYPENYPRRDYQFNIVQTALYNNTLVCLPTGLGKTFIAAVVMYNFWRWYPRGRVVFLAPTKPLVAQQINACHEIMGIPSSETVELTGAINQTKRATAWQQKRVIFATPQTFQKDLEKDYVPYELIKCIVMDEAHKALGKHSYCEIIRMLSEKSKFFRVLALSATPGSKIDHVRQVIQNLLISELELRDDTSPDITPYTNYRSMEKIIVNLDKDLTDYKNRYINIMDPHVRVLVRNQILQGNAANISKGRIFNLKKQYESRPNKAANHGQVMKTLTILLTMYHAYELLLKNGLRAFLHFYLTHSDKFWLDAELDLKLMLEDIKIYIGDFPVIQPSDDGTIPDIPRDLVFGHSKFKKLQDLLVDHFQSFSLQNKSTRAIVFVEYRDIVNEVYVLLLQTRPLIRPQMFVGQAGQKQKQQLAALEDFRNNKVNVLISTSVGEEGLDVGEVDLIVCFDISTSTPTRLVQRMGRTGRKRSGRVVLLLTEGKEVQTLNQALSKKDSLNTKVLQSSNIASSLYQSSPRMVPKDITPKCLAMFIKAQPKTPKAKAKKVGAPRKPAAEKKPRKTKNTAAQDNDDCLVLPSTSQFVPEPSTSNHKSVNNNQPSMMKYLTDQRQPKKSMFPHDTDSGFYEEFQQPESRDDPYSFIRPHQVKLLTSDNHALEFLTLCAMHKSTKEIDASVKNPDWLPPPDSTTSEQAFRNLTIPSTASLDCIRNLEMSEMPSTTKIDDDDSFFPDKSQIPRLDSFSRRDEGIVDDLAENKYKDSQDDLRLSASDFRDAFSDEDKRKSIVVSASSSQRNLEGVELSDLFCSFAADKPANSTIKQDDDKRGSQRRSSDVSPANVEVDFANLVDECTGSEASSLPGGEAENIFDDLLEDDEAENIFDDLLEGGSSTEDEDLFDEQNVTLKAEPNDQDETVREKRCASASPKRASPPKRQKLSHVVSDSSDNESTVVGTPPKKSPPAVDAQRHDSSAKQADELDSEEDIFDGMDLDETQYSEEEECAALPPATESRDEHPPSDMSPEKRDVDTSPAKREASASPVFNAREGASPRFTPAAARNTSPTKRETSVSPVFNAKGSASPSFCLAAEAEAVKKASPALRSTVGENAGVAVVNEDRATASDVASGFDDWSNDPWEKVSQPSRPKTGGASSGWIGAGQSQTQNKSSSLKSWCTKNRSAKITRLHVPKPQPAKTTTSKDQDGFAVPPAPKAADKENKLPVWRERLESAAAKKNDSEGAISPRFRKYRSESDLRSSIEKARKKRTKGHLRRPKARKRLACDFIEDEACVSSDCDTSDGSSGDEKNEYEDSFVSYTQDVCEQVDMRAHYLRTIGNLPPVRHGAFLIRDVKRKIPDSQIFSQPVSREEREESYLQDSFCVDDESHAMADDGSSSEAEESVLEQIESSLESRRRKMKREREKKRSKFECLRKNKKDSSCEVKANESSEDETEILRRQIMEESMMLKR